MKYILHMLTICVSLSYNLIQAQNTTEHSGNVKSSLDEAVHFRSIGPFRGGRSAAVCGVHNDPQKYYMGSTGGGVWKTENGGHTWENISDGFFGGSIGAVSVAESDPNVIYVGGGEVTVRGNMSSGNGVWKSVDAGKSWVHTGLERSRHIPRIRIHPKDYNIVYAAVLGDVYKSSQERGVYKSDDGGKTWRKVLFANKDAGAVDLILDPNNPRILYASTWRIRRTPFSLESGGEGSALWKSTDGGETWVNLMEKQGMPEGIHGIIGVTVSPLNSDRVYAIIENEKGGIFRSDDGGETWQLINSDRNLRQRAWYYSRIYADTQDVDKVYVLNVLYGVSKDGGKTFELKNSGHADHHDLWIAPENNKRMIIANDGGGQVTFDGGQHWSTFFNQPTAQYYRVTTDNHFPYRIYVAQQDNSTQRIWSRTDGSAITERDWETTAGCECATIAVNPENNDIVYGSCYDGLIERLDHSTKQSRLINVWPDLPMGHGAEGMKYRFQWNFPLFISPHNSDALFTASNHLHVTYDEGHSWEILSPDLTRNDSTKLGPSGGPITKDNTSVEYYCTIFAALESSHEAGVFWTGSDDGLIHISRDRGEHWSNVTPPISMMPEWIQINSIEEHPTEKGGLYVAATMYKHGDFRPYLFKTKDYGKSWEKITNGIDSEDFTRVIRADPEMEGLLFAGTENGLYMSFDDGENWRPMQGNLPIVPITDMTIKEDALVVATQGRSLWILDDLTFVRQMKQFSSQENTLFKPKHTVRLFGSQSKNTLTQGSNHPDGVVINFYLQDTVSKNDSIELFFLDANQDTIKMYANYLEKEDKLDVQKGFNAFAWDTRYPDGEKFEGMVLWWSSLKGPKALPGEYRVGLRVNEQELVEHFTILPDPRSKTTPSELLEQFEFIKGINEKTSEAHLAIVQIRSIRDQLDEYKQRLERENHNEIRAQIDSTITQMTRIEENLYQTKNRSPQDPLNYPVRLTNKLAHLNALSDGSNFRPTRQMLAVRDELIEDIDNQLHRWDNLKKNFIPQINSMIQEANIPPIFIQNENK